jgi:hypothetical protein
MHFGNLHLAHSEQHLPLANHFAEDPKMTQRITSCLLACLLAFGLIGCEPTPVVVTPDADDDTVVEERDVEVENDTTAPPQTDGGVNVDVGGENGVDVDVNKDADEATPAQ